MSDSYLLTLYGNVGDTTTSSLLSAIYGSGPATTATSTNPVVALQIAENTQTQSVANEAKQPEVLRDVAAFRTAVTNAKSAAQLLQNPTVLKVLLTSNGLGDQTDYPALAQKALLSDPSDPKSLVNQLSDTNWKSAASTYQFATKGLSVIQNPQVLDTIANGYAEVLWRQSLDAGTPGLSNALDFRDAASTITSVDQILGDSTLRTVVTTALGIPEQIAYQDIGAQEQAISSRLDISKFKDPAFVDSFVKRYLIAASASSGASTDTSSVASLIV